MTIKGLLATNLKISKFLYDENNACELFPCNFAISYVNLEIR